MERISAQVVVHGWVQGVYFRAYTRDQARLLGLAGMGNEPSGRDGGSFF